MKTIRDALLGGHQSATPKLDALRKRVLAAELAPKPGAPANPAFFAMLPRLWRELFWTSRRTWAGLAAAWCLILAVNHSVNSGDAPAPALAAHKTPSAAQLRSALAEQRHLRAEVLALLSADSAPPPEPPETRPRSEYRRAEAIA